MTLFLIIAIVWNVIGICGVIFEDYMKFDWCLVIYLVAFPFMPWIMHLCGLF